MKLNSTLCTAALCFTGLLCVVNNHNQVATKPVEPQTEVVSEVSPNPPLLQRPLKSGQPNGIGKQ
jgi:hypothetical protein